MVGRGNMCQAEGRQKRHEPTRKPQPTRRAPEMRRKSSASNLRSQQEVRPGCTPVPKYSSKKTPVVFHERRERPASRTFCSGKRKGRIRLSGFFSALRGYCLARTALGRLIKRIRVSHEYSVVLSRGNAAGFLHLHPSRSLPGLIFSPAGPVSLSRSSERPLERNARDLGFSNGLLLPLWCFPPVTRG